MMAELFDGALHGFDGRARERLRHVTDSASNQPLGCFRISFTKFAHSACDFRKQISGLKFEIILVQISHALGNARVPRAGERVFAIANLLYGFLIAQRESTLKKVRFGTTPKPTRETRALPRIRKRTATLFRELSNSSRRRPSSLRSTKP